MIQNEYGDLNYPLFEIPIKKVEDLIKIQIVNENTHEGDNVGTTTLSIDTIIPEVGKIERKLTFPLFHEGKRAHDVELIVQLKS